MTLLPGRIIILLLLCSAVAAAADDSHKPVLFNRDVRPILSDTCFKCHGPDRAKRQMDLRLDSFEDATHDRGDGFGVIVPGSPDKSEAYRRITSSDPEEKMPPPKSGMALTPAQIDILKRWIEQGAKYQPHWSLIPPATQPAPQVQNTAWVRNGIDPFILARLEQQGMHPSPEADRVTLIRRVTLDLTGLPPTPAEVD